MTGSVTQTHDAMVLAAWRYKPATLNGVPVKFRKVVRRTFVHGEPGGIERLPFVG